MSNMFQKQKIQVNGTVDPQFENVRTVFQDNFVKGEEISAQLCAVHKGKIVGSWQIAVLVQLEPMFTSGGGPVGLCQRPKLFRRHPADNL